MSTSSDVLVIGAGPAGLAVAASLRGYGLGVRLVDRHGSPGGAYARMYPPLVLSSPARYLDLPGLPLRSDDRYLSAGEYASYLAGYARRAGLSIEPRRAILVERCGRSYRVQLDGAARSEAYRFVVVATGMCDSPVIPEGIDVTEPGSEAHPTVMHSREWRGPRKHAVDRILIVGSGMRAVELAEECADAGADVVLSSRRAHVRTFRRKVFGIDLRHITFPLLRRAPRLLIGRRCKEGWRFPGIDSGFRRRVAEVKITVRGPLLELRRGRASFADDDAAWCPELVVLATGFRFETPFIASEIPRAAPGYPLVDRSELPELPNLFFLGIPCAFGADSHFLHGAARDARTVAATIAARVGVRRSPAGWPAPGTPRTTRRRGGPRSSHPTRKDS